MQSPPPQPGAWQDELGLASSALNDRYFSRQELLKNTKTDASDAGSRREGPTPSLDESNKVNSHSPDINGNGTNRDASSSSQVCYVQLVWNKTNKGCIFSRSFSINDIFREMGYKEKTKVNGLIRVKMARYCVCLHDICTLIFNLIKLRMLKVYS